MKIISHLKYPLRFSTTRLFPFKYFSILFIFLPSDSKDISDIVHSKWKKWLSSKKDNRKRLKRDLAHSEQRINGSQLSKDRPHAVLYPPAAACHTWVVSLCPSSRCCRHKLCIFGDFGTDYVHWLTRRSVVWLALVVIFAVDFLQLAVFVCDIDSTKL